jgi:hypothetical protein
VLIDWTGEFGRWLDTIELQGGPALEWATALLAELQDLAAPPRQETATFKRVRQARRHELWRLAHPYHPAVAIRIIVWFPDTATVVIALVGFDKARRGDLWYARAAVRGEAMVDQWQREHDGGNIMSTTDPTDEATTFESGTDRVSALRNRTDLKGVVGARRQELRQADRAHAMGLAMLRRAANFTQMELAEQLGVGQAAIAKLERRPDLLLSTLRTRSGYPRHPPAGRATLGRARLILCGIGPGVSCGSPRA